MNSHELNVNVPLATVESDSEEIEVSNLYYSLKNQGWQSESNPPIFWWIAIPVKTQIK